jgi:pyruvate/2-oxoglutarate dehydrogenase complex dihydrolipoamide dehydrogenase (E3) component
LPKERKIMKTVYDVDLCIIGAGSGGLSVAAGAAQLGRSVVLFEAEDMGGDCLNSGCVPSKALIAAGKQAHALKTGKPFGIAPAELNVSFASVKKHVQGVIDHIAPVDSQERFEGLGCTVIREYASFKDANTVESKTTEVRAKRFVVATGSRASAPPIPGLSETPYLTNETIFTVAKQPKHLLIIGAGPIGIELGQAFSRLGTKVEIVDISKPLGRSEPEHADILVKALESEGVKFHAPVKTKLIRKTKTGVAIDFEDGTTLTGGIDTDDNLRSSNPKVYAVGDVAAGKGGLTHAAGYHAGQIIKAFYFLPPVLNKFMAKAKTDIMPAAIYSEPELANIGLSAAEAREKGYDIRELTAGFDHNDRAIAERSDEGGVKIIATTKGKILGASIVGEGAGDLIQMISVAMKGGVKISGLAQIISPYPTRGEAVKRAAGSFYTDAVFSPKSRKLAAFNTRFH